MSKYNKHFKMKKITRMTRDVAPRLGYLKPALLHSSFFPAMQAHIKYKLYKYKKKHKYKFKHK